MACFACTVLQEGSQFCRGFGGIGGLLRWRLDFAEMEMLDEAAINAANKDWDQDDNFI